MYLHEDRETFRDLIYRLPTRMAEHLSWWRRITMLH